jgi:hypothetical protein
MFTALQFMNPSACIIVFFMLLVSGFALSTRRVISKAPLSGLRSYEHRGLLSTKVQSTTPARSLPGLNRLFSSLGSPIETEKTSGTQAETDFVYNPKKIRNFSIIAHIG